MTAVPAPRSVYDALLEVPDHQVGEVIAGELVVSPRPAGAHATVTMALGSGVYTKSDRGGRGGGWWIREEPELHLGGETSLADVLVPDLAGWRRERLPRYPATPAVTLVPDWVCEVLSPGSAARDRGIKAARYLHHGLAWYWLVDPAARRVEVMRAEAGSWVPVATASNRQRVKLPPFEDVLLRLSTWWLEPA